MSREVAIQSFGKTIKIQRLLGKIKGKQKGPTIIAIGGIHGNEKAGVQALLNVFDSLKNSTISLNGNFYGIAGNLEALQQNKRFIDVDLNRIWTSNIIDNTINLGNLSHEYLEQSKIYELIKSILEEEKGPFYFLDLHTTSAQTSPFITISDSLNNRKFSSNFNVPIILGIEEYLDEPLLSYINKFGHVALGFEGGQHTDVNSISATESFLYLALEATKCVKKSQLKNFKKHQYRLQSLNKRNDFFEIKYRYEIVNNTDFNMLPGFENFDDVYTNQLLAYHNGRSIKSHLTGEIFLPLYQKKGTDGFFLIQQISKTWIVLSKFLRKLNLDAFLRLLPGIKKHKFQSNTLIVNPNIASLFTTDFFHLFGYRKKVLEQDKWLFTKRDKRIKSIA